MNHLGVGCGYAWIPLGMWGIEQASRQQSWRPLWKLAIASAMCFLAGYPANWAAFALVAVAFAIASPGYLKLAMQSVSALAFSLLLSAVALLPSMEAARMKTPEQVFGGGLMEAPGIWLSYLLPNFYDQNRTGPGPEMLEGPYLYLGAVAIFALLWAIRHPRRKSLLPSVSIAAASFWFMTDPGEVLTRVMMATIPLAGDVIRQFNFLLGPAFAAALLTTDSLDNFLNVPTGWRVPNALRILWLVSAVVFSGLLVLIWQHLGVVAFTGLASAGYVLVLLALFGLGMVIYRCQPTAPVVLALLTMVFLEYKAFGTNRKFNAHTGNADRFYRGDARLGGRSLRGLDDEVYEQIKREPYYRVAIVAGFHATDFRHYSLTTPQGFDPFLPEPYKRAVEAYVPFQTNRLFAIDPLNLPFLDRFAVRFVMTQADTPEDRKLVEHQSFRLLEPSTSFFRIHELIGARPIWRFSGDVKPAHWSPERRTFRVDSRQGGAFTLVEQFFPGWHATVDGRENPLEVSDGAFQSTQVPAGKHEVAFVYRPLSLRIGAVLSLISTVILSLVAVKRL
ncbi:MAG: YfhO family protein [Bryobacteraceae bacterium]|nr:YfhO family protein [Bryobacteraceae bacterium]